MTPLKRIIPLLLTAILSACIELPEIAEPDPPADAGTQPDGGSPIPDAGVTGFTLTVTPSQVAIPQGSSHTFQVSITRKQGFQGIVLVDVANPPADISPQSAMIPAGSTSAELSISVAASAAPGVRFLTVKGTSGEHSTEASIEVTVLPAGELFVRWGTPNQSSVYVNGPLFLTVSVEGGTADSVEFLKGGAVLKQLIGPPYQFNWDTSQEAEGTYQVTARANRGGSMFLSTTLSVTVDRTAPTVTSLTPLPGSAFVSAQTPINASFSEALRPSSVTDSSVLVSTGSSNLGKSLSIADDGKTLTITPPMPLPLQSEIGITLGSTAAPLTDLAGNPLTSPPSWIFTVPAWLPLGGPISAESGSTSAENVAMKVGSDGNPVIAWSESNTSERNIYAYRWNGTNWVSYGFPLSAISGPGTDADMPALALDSENRPIIMWQEKPSSSGNLNLYGRRWTGTDWTSLPTLALGQDEWREEPTIAFDSTGHLLMCNYKNEGGINGLELFRLPPSFSSWESLTTGTLRAPFQSALASAASGNWFLAVSVLDWDTQPESRSILVQKRHYTSSSWTKLGALVSSPARNTSTVPDLVLDGNGQPIVAWQESTSTTSNIHAAAWNGTAWQLLGESVSGSTSSSTSPALVMGNEGRPLVAWSGYSASERTIQVSQWTGSAWTAVGVPLNSTAGADKPGFRPQLATTSNGHLFVAWHEFDGTASNIHVCRYNN